MEITIQSKKHGDKIVLIDAEDFEKISNFKWHVNYNKKNNYYIQANIYVNGKRTTKSLHKIIMGDFKDKIIDHINGNTLDCRKENMRFVTNQENSFNQKVSKNKKSSKHKGIYHNKKLNNWKVLIKYNYKNIYIGVFDTEQKAVNAYNEKAKELFGEYARLNDNASLFA